MLTYSFERLSKCLWMLFCSAWSVGSMAPDLYHAKIIRSVTNILRHGE